MDPFATPDIRVFRDEVRTFIEENLTPDLARAGRRATSVFVDPSISLAWQAILNARGWAVPDWPVEYGGPGWNDIQRYVFAEECARARAPGLAPQGLKMVAPVIMHYGTEAQKAEYLPRMLSGEDYWCQGYSEPGAGSDLAKLSLRAVRDGDDYVLNGSKIWTTHAHFANRMFCLVRTNTAGRPQAGITFLLLDMGLPGITVRPIPTLAGEHEFNQVFFDDVRVPVSGRLGEENDGWTVAKHLLTFERGGRYAPGLGAHVEALRQAGEATGWLAEPGNRERLAREAIAVEALRAIELASLSGHGPADTVRPSMLKVLGTETSQRLDLLALDMAAEWEGDTDNAPDAIAIALPRYLNNRASSIYAGSNEIQRDLIARVVVG
jgi:alkylation response protein AidB-like acyl-CoA dehydrogenase